MTLREMDEIDLVLLGVPNHLHCQVAVDAARAGKHIVLEKPMCLNLAEADQMLAACRKAKVKLMYAEELCFAPKYVRLKQLLDSGALGDPVLLKQSEKHDGPHAAHFWDVNRSGGVVTMDMGCHAIEFFRWMLGRPPIKSVYAQMGTHVHKSKTKGDDNAILILEFANGTVAMAEGSWTKLGGMDDRPKSTAPKASPSPTFFTATPSKPTALSVMTTPSRKPAQLSVGPSRSTKKFGITASFKRWRTSSIVSKTTKLRSSLAKTPAPFWKLSLPLTNPLAPVAK